MRLFRRIRYWLSSSALDADLRDELAAHREMLEHDLVARGHTPGKARDLARRAMGNETYMREESRGVWFGRGMEAVVQDAKYAVRTLRRSPRFALTALALLVLGIGSTTAILSIVYEVLVRPLPYADADRLVFITEKDGAGVAWPNFLDWQSSARSFDGLAGSFADAAILRSGELPRRFESRAVTWNFFRVLGVGPAQGRLFDAADARADAPLAIVVSHRFWATELAASPAAIGRKLQVGAQIATVVGVLPPDFRYLTSADIYRPIEPLVATNYRGMQSRTTHTTYYVVGRLKDDVPIETARVEMQRIQQAIGREFVAPKQLKNLGADLKPLSERIIGTMGPTLTVLGGAVTLLLLITCVNLAALLLNRGSSRASEFRIRAAIGGSRWQVMRQLLVEHGVLIAVGAVLGAVAGAWILVGFVYLAPRDMPRLEEIHVDLGVISSITVLTCICAFVFGIVPMLRTVGASGEGMRAGQGVSRHGGWLRSGLMIGEIALATVLLSGSALMVHTMVRLNRVDPGFDPRHLQTAMFSLSGRAWTEERQQAFYPRVVERLRAIPGVEDASITYSLPILGSNWWTVFMIQGVPAEHWNVVGEAPNAGMVPATPGYFEMLRIPLVKGRYFDGTDAIGSQPVAIVNATAAQKYWPNESPIGKQIQLGFPGQPYGPVRTIVGVVGDIRQDGVDHDASRQVFLPATQQSRTTMYAIIRTSGAGVPPASIANAIHDLDRTIPVFNDRTLGDVMTAAVSYRRTAMVVLSVFGVVALILAAIGLYGVIAQGVADRRQEIGVRIALGATAARVIRMFLSHAAAIIAIGVPVGVAAAIVASRSLSGLVFGIKATDPLTYASVAAVLIGITIVASYLPALAATRIDPLKALRGD